MKQTYRILKLHFKRDFVICFAGAFRSESAAYNLHTSKYHFRVIYKILIYYYSIIIFSKMNPFRHNINVTVSFLQNYNICCNLCSCIFLKCIIWKSYCPYKLCSLGNILSYLYIFLIKRSFTCNEHNNSTGSYLIKSLCKEIIVNKKIMLVIPTVSHLKVTERHIAYCNIKETVRQRNILKTIDTYT